MSRPTGDKVLKAYMLGMRDERAKWLWAYHSRHVRTHREDGMFKTCGLITCRMARELAYVEPIP